MRNTHLGALVSEDPTPESLLSLHSICSAESSCKESGRSWSLLSGDDTVPFVMSLSSWRLSSASTMSSMSVTFDVLWWNCGGSYSSEITKRKISEVERIE